MNRYVAEGVLADMRAGRRIAVVCGTRSLARIALDQVASLAADGERVRRANGEEEITAGDGGGWVTFGGPNLTRLRGIVLDVVVFDGILPGGDALRDVAASMCTSRHGEVIRA